VILVLDRPKKVNFLFHPKTFGFGKEFSRKKLFSDQENYNFELQNREVGLKFVFTKEFEKLREER